MPPKSARAAATHMGWHADAAERHATDAHAKGPRHTAFFARLAADAAAACAALLAHCPDSPAARRHLARASAAADRATEADAPIAA